MMEVEIQVDEAFEGLLEAAPVRGAVLAALRHEGAAPPSALTLRLSGDEVLRDLNLRFMGIDAPTDVLSFPSAGSPGPGVESYLGDIIISVESARRQAAEGGHTLDDEIKLLAVHGALHLLGHDHADAGEKKRMWAVQAAVLESLGVPLSPP